jgi:hypothetical protein
MPSRGRCTGRGGAARRSASPLPASTSSRRRLYLGQRARFSAAIVLPVGVSARTNVEFSLGCDQRFSSRRPQSSTRYDSECCASVAVQSAQNCGEPQDDVPALLAGRCTAEGLDRDHRPRRSGRPPGGVAAGRRIRRPATSTGAMIQGSRDPQAHPGEDRAPTAVKAAARIHGGTR